MTPPTVAAAEEDLIEQLVAHYVLDIRVYESLTDNLRSLVELPALRSLCHSVRWRVKDPDHLRHKLHRRLVRLKDDGKPFDITKDNLFDRITDLSGVRLLHLHTTQFGNINSALLELLEENRYSIVEGPEARTWDDEYRAYFESIGVSTVSSARMYTSVHYVIAPNTKTRRTMEIQVRTLAEELWGEVDHTINYPVQSHRLGCREQIKVLARLTSSCTRLVDSIFLTNQE